MQIVPPRLELEGTRLFQAVENRVVQVRLIDGELLEEVVQASDVGDERRLLRDEGGQELALDADVEDSVGVRGPPGTNELTRPISLLRRVVGADFYFLMKDSLRRLPEGTLNQLELLALVVRRGKLDRKYIEDLPKVLVSGYPG